MKAKRENEAGMGLLTLTLVFVSGAGMWCFYKPEEMPYISAEALVPLKPRFVKTTIEYEPITPSDRISYVHSLPQFQKIALPLEIAAGHSYAAAERK